MASIKGTTGKDFLVGTSSADNIEGFAGDDEIRGGSGNDTLRGDQNRSNDITLYANKDWAKYYSDINTLNKTEFEKSKAGSTSILKQVTVTI